MLFPVRLKADNTPANIHENTSVQISDASKAQKESQIGRRQVYADDDFSKHRARIKVMFGVLFCVPTHLISSVAKTDRTNNNCGVDIFQQPLRFTVDVRINPGFWDAPAFAWVRSRGLGWDWARVWPKGG